jgi:hypothetical protein
MENENTQTTENVADKLAIVKDIKAKSAEKIEKGTQGILDAIVDHVAEQEVTKRKALAIKAHDDIAVKTKELNKIKADIETFDDNGNPLPKTWSKTKNEERKKAQEALDKAVKEFNKALTTGDFSKLAEMYK